MKHKFIETFTDIDDKYIAEAKPAAQKPMELRPETRRPAAAWKKITAAAVCLAVFGGGSALAVKRMNPQIGISSSDTSLSSGISPNSSGNGSGNDSDSGSGSANIFNTEIEYQDTTYEVVNAANYDGVIMSVGFRQKEYGRGSFVFGVISVENTTDKPIAFVPGFYDSDWVGVDIDGLVGRFSRPFINNDIIQPGEVCYQEMIFDTCTQNFESDFDRYNGYKTTNLVDAGRYNGKVVLKYIPDADATCELIVHTMDFSIDIGDWNTGDQIGGNVKVGDEDKELQHWGPLTFTIREDFPGDTFECDYRSVSLINGDGSKTRLFGGKHLANLTVCDINNDGYGDIIATVDFETTSVGNNMTRSCVFVYDHKNKQLYAIADFDKYDILEYVKPDKGTSGMGGRVMIKATTLGDNAEQIYLEPLTFDMLRPCVLKENGEPLFADRFKSKYSNGDEFEYESKSYRVISIGCGGSDVDDEGKIVEGYNIVAGVRRDIIGGVDTVEFAAFVENIGITLPIGLMSSTASPDKPILFKFELNDASIKDSDFHHIFDDYEFKFMPYILQPGEKLYQTVSFPVTEAEYVFSTCCYLTDPNRFDESKTLAENKSGGYLARQRADFSDKSVSFDNVYQLF